MARAVQKRTLETRARLIAAAEDVIADAGFEALRVEEVVLRAGTAKGTFFAHFKDKDALMDLIIGARIDAELDRMAAARAPRTVSEMVAALMPLCDLMTCERYVFDVIMRYSGAAGIEEIGAIATTFGRQV
ncbi:MAG: helix-turn-helix domain-containing protein, partial [Pseudomonadota bacterium]